MQWQINSLRRSFQDGQKDILALERQLAAKDSQLMETVAELRKLKTRISQLIMETEAALTVSQAVRNSSTMHVYTYAQLTHFNSD